MCLQALGVCREGPGRLRQGTQCPEVGRVQPGPALTPASSPSTHGAPPSSWGSVDQACSLLSIPLQGWEVSRLILSSACLLPVPGPFYGVVSISSTGLTAACKSFLGAKVRYSPGSRWEVNITSSIDLVEAPSQLWLASPLSVRALTLMPLRVAHSPLRLGLCPDEVWPWGCQDEPGPLPMSLLHGSHSSGLQVALGPFSVATPVGVPQN